MAELSVLCSKKVRLKGDGTLEAGVLGVRRHIR
jgi:hypothetical protein